MILLFGPSASGKTEIAKLLEIKYGLTKAITHTTRPMRVGEIQDVDYHFVSKDTFLLMKENNEFVETTLYSDNYYGTSKKEIADDKCAVLDPSGIKSFKELNDKSIFIVYITCSEETRINRMHLRRDENDKILLRINNDRLTFSENDKALADLTISSEDISSEVLCKIIYNTYSEHLRK